MPNERVRRCVTAFLLVLLAPAFCCWSLAGNMKGNLTESELAFLDHTVTPILIRARMCVNATGDCEHDLIICMSSDALSCDVYGVPDGRVAKEILSAVLQSGLRVSSFRFWRSKFHKTSLFEKPLVQFIDRTGSK